MFTRLSRSMVTFSKPFTLAGTPEAFPPGEYEIIVEEELLHGLSFEAYRRTATYLKVVDRGARSGRTKMRLTTEQDLERALARDRPPVKSKRTNSEAALSPLEDTT